VVRAAAVLAVLAALGVYYGVSEDLPGLPQWGDVAFLGLGLMPLTLSLVWLALPLRETNPRELAVAAVSLVLLAVLCYGVAVNIAVPLQQRYGALPVLLRAQLVALVLLAPAALVSLPNSDFAWSSALAVVALGFFGTGWAFVAMTTLVGRVGATRGSVAIYFLPVVAIALGVIFRDETIAAISLVGTGLVLAGAYLTSRRE